MMEGDESARGESPGASLGPAAPPQVAGIPLAEESTSPTMKRKMSIDGLRRELEKQTRETQKLQEEVEQATKLTMEKLNYTLSGTDDGGPSSQSTPTTGKLKQFQYIKVCDGREGEITERNMC
nr:PREDICTED: uncharacterized protein LOC106706521 isoform X3 [Latimeria chalumnae]|eukprot:XP_014353091.1 PREDICTED: uncharacterized protein LOC106706521 isoform X3 [Latimeria chalumnae]